MVAFVKLEGADDLAIIADGRVRPREVTTFVYALEAPTVPLFKFGRSDNPAKRLITYNSSSPVEIVLRGYVELPWEFERRIHYLLAPYRVRGEWFLPEPPVIDMVNLIVAKEGASILRLFLPED